MKPRSKGSPPTPADPGACIRASTECRTICLKTGAYVAERSIAGLGQDFLANLHTCADLCRLCADTIMRGSDLHPIVCGACAEVCACCAAACEEAGGDAQLDECRQACLDCFDVCSAMAAEVA